MEPKSERLYYKWVVVAAIIVIGTVAIGMRFSFGVFFSALQSDFGWNRANTSSIFSLYMLLSTVFVLFGGWALDLYGARKVFTLSGVFVVLSLFLTSRVTASWQIFLTYSLLFGIGSGPIYVLSMSTISRWFTKGRGLALGIVSCGNSVGMIVFSPISAFLISRYDWKTAYLIISVVAFFTMIPCALLLKKPPVNPADLSDEDGRGDGEPLGLSFSQAIRRNNFWLLIIILFLTSLCVYAALTHLVPHAMDIGIAPMKAASLLSFVGLGTIPGRLLMGRALDSIGSKPGMLICTALLVVTMLWLIGASNLWMLYLFAIVFGFAFGAIAPLNADLIGENFGLRHIGLIMGVIEIGWSTGAAIGPALTGYIFDVAGSYNSAFLGGGAAAFLATALILFLRPPNLKE